MSTSAYFLACDDIRQEANGKETLIGVYGPSIIVPELPSSLQRLILRLSVRSPISMPHRIRRVRVERPGMEDKDIDIPFEEYGEPSEEQVDEDVKFFDTTLVFNIGPMEITKLGRIKVYVDTEEGEIYAGSMRLSLPQDEGLLQALDVQAALGAVGLYASNRKLEGDESSRLARAVMEALAESSLGSAIQIAGDFLIVRLGGNRFRVFYSDLSAPKPSLRIEKIPEPFQLSDVETDEFGAVLVFSPQTPDIPSFQLDSE